MARELPLFECARVLRSKNAGPFELTLDIMFDDSQRYAQVRDSGVITRELVARLYRVPPEDVYTVVAYDPALAIKITLRRPVDSGGVGDTDVYGAQQHAPLLGVRIPLAENPGGGAKP